MPEGDTIHIAARNLSKVLVERVITEATGRRELQCVEQLVGQTVQSVEARGKHLIIHFTGEFVIHSHMGMTGSWHIYRVADRWQKPARQAFVVLRTTEWCVVCFTPKQLRLITETALRRDPYLQHLGPDLLADEISDDVFLARMRTQNTDQIGHVLMNQQIVAGIGNVYRSELLFLENLHPDTLVQRLTNQQLLNLRDRIVPLMKRNMDGNPRTTRFEGDRFRHWVYGRRNEPCLKCGATIELLRQGDLARSVYFCPSCQPDS